MVDHTAEETSPEEWNILAQHFALARVKKEPESFPGKDRSMRGLQSARCRQKQPAEDIIMSDTIQQYKDFVITSFVKAASGKCWANIFHSSGDVSSAV